MLSQHSSMVQGLSSSHSESVKHSSSQCLPECPISPVATKPGGLKNGGGIRGGGGGGTKGAAVFKMGEVTGSGIAMGISSGISGAIMSRAATLSSVFFGSICFWHPMKLKSKASGNAIFWCILIYSFDF
jgi:hypothetical protein